jgi:hypothetical protein
MGSNRERYEYEKGKFAVLKQEDFARVNIMNFVKIDDVDPLLFYKPYYLEIGRGGDKAYVLLRDSVAETRKIAIGQAAQAVRRHAQLIPQQPASLHWLGRATVRALQLIPLPLFPTLGPKCERELDNCAEIARRSRPQRDKVQHPKETAGSVDEITMPNNSQGDNQLGSCSPRL